jgi:hypothetical protein
MLESELCRLTDVICSLALCNRTQNVRRDDRHSDDCIDDCVDGFINDFVNDRMDKWVMSKEEKSICK